MKISKEKKPQGDKSGEYGGYSASAIRILEVFVQLLPCY
jgi:hypothetical protein